MPPLELDGSAFTLNPPAYTSRRSALPQDYYNRGEVMGEFDLPVAVIGAGPFGVSTAAYLRSRGVEFRIFGSPMNRWRTQMPAGMFLKSEGFASNLADPTGRCTLQQFCEEET